MASATLLAAVALSSFPAAQTTGTGLVRLAGACSAQPGATVTFDVQALNFTSGLAGLQGTITYDPAALALVDVTAPGDGPFAGGPRVSRSSAPGEIRFAALDCDSTSPASEIPVAARLRFQVTAASGAGLALGLADVVVLDASGGSLPAQTAGASLLVFELPDRDCDGVADAADNCPDLANAEQTDTNGNGVGDACEPLFAELLYFRAQRWGRGSVLLTWATASEPGTTGFNVSRGPTSDGPWTLLNESPIPAAGDETSGASYEFTDRRVTGRVYYQLSEIGATGREQGFTPIEVRGPAERNPRRQQVQGGDGS